MDFSKQCKRFLNYRVFDENEFGKKLTNISALATFQNIQKQNNVLLTINRIVLFDNDLKCILIINESDGKILRESKNLNFVSYSLCCTNKTSNNYIYLSDYTNNVIRKYDESLNELKQLNINPDKSSYCLNGPCGIMINNELEQIHCVDQKNQRLVRFDLKTDEYLSEFRLFQEDILDMTKYAQVNTHDLSRRMTLQDQKENLKKQMELDFWPFGLFTKNERIYVTDWFRSFLYIYKNDNLEAKIGGEKFFRHPRDILLDSLQSILVVDLQRHSLHFMDNKGVYMFETKLPCKKKSKERGVFGLSRLGNNLVFASSSSVYICYLNAND